ncbi:putative disease resistance RPP13-like protein 1 [Amaranthus tricolor]|uniref:putative disease resistance RPP13-like protein 1 n=1 Tax=Amaranthus tricolor TaxID=29722 RepID=UPI00258D2ACE|nr:putative disease resistance RPP13-like protein 1 [Amaranthus tricolor]
MPIVETILGAVLAVVLDKLASKEVVDFVKTLKLDQSLFMKLKRLMLVVEKLLADAEHRQITDPAVKSWLSELQHIFYRTEEIVDEISTQALLSSMNATSKRKSLNTKVKNLFPAFSSSSFVKTANSKMKKVVIQLEDMVSESTSLNLKEVSVKNTLRRMPTSYMLDDTQLVGRKQEKKELLSFLLSEEAEQNNLSVVAIVGMGGLGKTTLAKMVYNDDRLGFFDMKAWIYVSDRFDILQITKSVIECITLQLYSGSLELSALQYELSILLKRKKFLLVLDDVWNEKYEEWDCLRAPLALGAKVCKVIVTTRNDGVTNTMRTAKVIRLKPLSDEDGLLLLSKHALGVGYLSSSLCTEFIDIGRKIVHKCSGLPLAIKTLGGILWSKQDIKDWNVILESSVWDLRDNQSNIVPALRLSYHHLPAHLKQCFSYCALFPKGHRFDRKGLVLLWMAQNFVQQSKSSSRIECIGEQYLCQLLSYSFFERTDGDEFLMHDLMHDLAQDVTGDFFARQESGHVTSNISEKVRFFSYFRDHYDVFSKFEHLYGAKYLRTFCPLPRWTSVAELGALYGIYDCYLSNKISTEFIPQLHCLRVLSLCKYHVLKLPESIGNLKQLRFLDVSETRIKELPESICKLYHLQTLLLFQCKKLERLPANLSILQSLRHLDLKGTSSLRQMPQHISKLTSLQTMTDFVLCEQGGASIRELSELMQIRGELSIRSLQNIPSPDEALAVNLSSREYLQELAFTFDNFSNDCKKSRAILENLKPPTNLERLIIKKYPGLAFPSWLDTQLSIYTNIVNLLLSGCVYCYSLPPLGLLPSLKHLEISGMDYITSIGAEFYAYDSGLSNPFPALSSLVFKDMKSWEAWLGHEIEGRRLPFPCLETLSLHTCPKFKGELPLHLPFLKELDIKGCDRLPNSFLQPPSLHCSPQSASLSLFHLTSLASLKLHNLILLVSLPPEIDTLYNLETLSINNCPTLVSLAEFRLPPKIRCLEIMQCEIIRSLPKAMVHSTTLRELSLYHCPCLCFNGEDNLPTSLTDLKIKSCEKWKFVPFNMPNTSKFHHYSLEFITFENIGKTLIYFPLGIFPKLQHLTLDNCIDLEAVYIPTGMDLINLRSLERLIVKNNPKLRYIGRVKKVGVVDLPTPNLRDLHILSCDNVKLLTGDSEEGLPSNVEILFSDSFEKISGHRNTLSFLMFSFLRVLHIQHYLAECFPVKGTLPTSVSTLILDHFPNLKFLNVEALKTLKCFLELHILHCPNLMCLPEEKFPHTLGRLDISGCPLVEVRCEKDKGIDWPKISHLPCVKINDIYI